MEKIAIIELNEKNLSLSIYKISNGKSMLALNKNQYHDIGIEIESLELVSPKLKNEILDMLKIYRKMIEDHKVDKIFAVCSNIILRARNYRGIFDEIYNNTGLNFTILSDEDTIKYLFNAIVNNIDNAKGVFLHIGGNNCYLVRYNRRAILSSTIIPVGTYNTAQPYQNLDQMVDSFKKNISSKIALGKIEEEVKVAATGISCLALGKLAKKVQRYSLDLDNNYTLTKDILDKTCQFVSGIDLDKIKKIKGIDYEEADKILIGIALIKALFELLGLNEVSITTSNVRRGLLQFNVLNAQQERFNDLLSNSLESFYEFAKDEFSINPQVYNMATILFKQLKVMHKLPRFYVKPLRIASFMYDCGKCINAENYTKYGFDKIVFSDIVGATHKELLIAGFICKSQNLDDLSLNEWIKYKDILTDEDLDAVRKLGIIVKLAVALNASGKPVVNDIVCDILGDSIIMKTIVDGDARYEILEGMKVAQDYKKVFKKSLQII